MNNVMSKAENPYRTPTVELNTIWLVEADKTYEVTKKWAVESEYTIVRTFEGSGTIVLKDHKKINLGKNSLICLKSDLIEQYSCNNTKWHFIWFEFNAETSILIELNTIYYLEISDTEKEDLLLCFDELNSLLPFVSLKASCDFCSILAKWKCELNNENSVYTSRIETAIRYSIQNSSSNITVKELSQYVGMSERSFRNAFIQHTNKSPKKYFEDQKLNTSRILLQNTNMQIKEIALSLGFVNQYYFSRAFKNSYGVSPKQYRKNIHK